MPDAGETNNTTAQSEPTPEPEAVSSEEEQFSFARFLEGVPPGRFQEISDAVELKRSLQSGPYYEIVTPEILLHCSDDICNGPRIFRFADGSRTIHGGKSVLNTFISYLCSNCRRTTKLFSLHVDVSKEEKHGVSSCYKFGEYPPYGPPTPSRLLRLFGKDRDVFLKGRQCENHALGIGAFVYYRRVVENHKDQILGEIIKVAKKVAPETVEALEAAKQEKQFSNAMASVKDAIPQSLRIDGQNPLTLLHSALSEGLHNKTDADCLELAHDVRVVLAELADRIGQALKDEAELIPSP